MPILINTGCVLDATNSFSNAGCEIIEYQFTVNGNTYTNTTGFFDPIAAGLAAGIYTVTVVVVDCAGVSNTASLQIEIPEPQIKLVDTDNNATGFFDGTNLDYSKFNQIDISAYGGSASTDITSAADIINAFAALGIMVSLSGDTLTVSSGWGGTLVDVEVQQCNCTVLRIGLSQKPANFTLTYNSATKQFAYIIDSIIQTGGTVSNIQVSVLNITQNNVVVSATPVTISAGTKTFAVNGTAPNNGDLLEFRIEVTCAYGTFASSIKRGHVVVNGTAQSVGTLTQTGGTTSGSFSCNGYQINSLSTYTTSNQSVSQSYYNSFDAQDAWDTMEAPLPGSTYLTPATLPGFIPYSAVNIGQVFYDTHYFLEDVDKEEMFVRNVLMIKQCS